MEYSVQCIEYREKSKEKGQFSKSKKKFSEKAVFNADCDGKILAANMRKTFEK